jgi:hypothetical protein
MRLLIAAIILVSGLGIQPSLAQAPLPLDANKQIVPPTEYLDDDANPNYQWKGFTKLLSEPQYNHAGGCNHAVLVLYPFVDAIEQQDFPFSNSGLDPDDFLKAAADFDHECLTPYDTNARPPDPDVGVLFVQVAKHPNFPQCTVVKLGDHLFLTAFHCIAAQSHTMLSVRFPGQPTQPIHVNWLPSGEQMRTVGNRFPRNGGVLPTEFPIPEILQGAGMDYAFLIPVGATPPADFTSKLHAAAKVAQQRVTSVSYYHFLFLADYLRSCRPSSSCGNADKVDVSKWVNAVRKDSGKACIVVAADPLCLLHGCQEVMRGSGAPLFVDNTHLAGLHLRGIYDGRAIPCAGKTMHTGNVGRTAPSAIDNPGELQQVARDLRWLK